MGEAADDLSIGDIKAHLALAARDELLGVATMELMILKLDDPRLVQEAMAGVRRRAAALGAAFRLVCAIEARPDVMAQIGAETGATR